MFPPWSPSFLLSLPGFCLFGLFWVALCRLGFVAQAADPTHVRWGEEVLWASSERDSGHGSWMARGEPDVFPAFGDLRNTWMPRNADDQREFLGLRYAGGRPADGLAVFETWLPGAIDRLEVRHALTGEWIEVWTGTATILPEYSRILIIRFPRTSFPVDGARVELNSPAVPGWQAIDAMALLDGDPSGVVPRIGAFDITSEETGRLYTELEPVTVGGRVTLTDYINGVSAVTLQLIDPAGQPVGAPAAATPPPGHSYSGDWSTNLEFPRGTPAGLYGVRITATGGGGTAASADQAGVFRILGSLPRPTSPYHLSKLVELGDLAHRADGRDFKVTGFTPTGGSPAAPVANRRGAIAFFASSSAGDESSVGVYRHSGSTLTVLAHASLTGLAGAVPRSLNDAGWVALTTTANEVPGVYKTDGTTNALIDSTPDAGDAFINNHGVVAYRRGDPAGVWELWKGDGATRNRVFATSDVTVQNASVLALPPFVPIESAVVQYGGIQGMDDAGWVHFSAGVELTFNRILPEIGYQRKELLHPAARIHSAGSLQWRRWAAPTRLYREATSFSVSPGGRTIGRASPQSGGAQLSTPDRPTLPPSYYQSHPFFLPLWLSDGLDWMFHGHTLLRDEGGVVASTRGGTKAFPMASINDSGRVAYLATTDQGERLMSSADPSRPILLPDHLLDGRRVRSVLIGPQAIGDRGDIVMLVVFTDGHEALYRAEPPAGSRPEYALPPNSRQSSAPAGPVEFSFAAVPSGAWVDLPARGEAALQVMDAGARIVALQGISDEVANPVEVVVRGVVVGTLRPGSQLDLEALSASSSLITLRGLTVSAARPLAPSIRLALSTPASALEIKGAGIPLLIQPPLRPVELGQPNVLSSGAVDPEGVTYRWSRPVIGPLTDGTRMAGTAHPDLGIDPLEETDLGTYILTAYGTEGQATVTGRVLAAERYGSWVERHFPGQPIESPSTGSLATPLRDGISNFQKYAFGIDPTRPATREEFARLPTLHQVTTGVEPRLTLNFHLRAEPADYNIRIQSTLHPYAPTWSDLDPQHWSLLESPGENGDRQITILLPTPSESRLFYRVYITPNGW